MTTRLLDSLTHTLWNTNMVMTRLILGVVSASTVNTCVIKYVGNY